MTAKQKANRERFKKVVAEAKKLRKKNPKLTQAQAVKQAWAIQISKEKKNPINRVKKYIEEAKEGIRRGYYGSEYKKKGKKVGAVKKKAAPKKSSSYHKDTKSHNVNIRVVSGIEKMSGKMIAELSSVLNKIRNFEEQRDRVKSNIKYKKLDKGSLKYARTIVKFYNDRIRDLKKEFSTIKKHIK